MTDALSQHLLDLLDDTYPPYFIEHLSTRGLAWIVDGFVSSTADGYRKVSDAVAGLSDFDEIIAALDREAWHGTDEDHFTVLMIDAIEKMPVSEVLELCTAVLRQHDDEGGQRTAADMLGELAWSRPTELVEAMPGGLEPTSGLRRIVPLVRTEFLEDVAIEWLRGTGTR